MVTLINICHKLVACTDFFVDIFVSEPSCLLETANVSGKRFRRVFSVDCGSCRPNRFRVLFSCNHISLFRSYSSCSKKGTQKASGKRGMEDPDGLVPVFMATATDKGVLWLCDVVVVMPSAADVSVPFPPPFILVSVYGVFSPLLLYFVSVVLPLLLGGRCCCWPPPLWLLLAVVVGELEENPSGVLSRTDSFSFLFLSKGESTIVADMLHQSK